MALPYAYQARIYLDLSIIPQGTGGALYQQANSNIGGYMDEELAGAPAFAQTLRKVAVAVVPNNMTVPPTANNIRDAITTCAQNIANRLSPDELAMIANWTTGQQ